jgi:hypothetical protein
MGTNNTETYVKENKIKQQRGEVHKNKKIKIQI